MIERWKPEIGEAYYFFDSDFNVTTAHYNGYSWDEKRIAMGNCFNTKDAVCDAAEKVQALLLSLRDNTENLQENIQDMVTSTCQAMDKGKENVAKATCTFGNLPKLTAEVFDRPDCPEWAQWAAVDEDGMVALFEHRPTIAPIGKWWDRKAKYCPLDGRYDYADWQNSLIERPAQLPDWCKVGEWVYDGVREKYRKIIRIDMTIKGCSAPVIFFNEDPDLLSPSMQLNSIGGMSLKQARLRPYNAEEMKALVGKVIEVEPGIFSLCLRVNGHWADFLDDCDNEDDRARIIAYDCDMLKHRNTIDGKPCGIFEHMENGEWV